MTYLFGVRYGLAAAGRIQSEAQIRERISISEILALLFCGAVSASLIAFVKLGLRIPGHSIVLSMLPMVFGLALSPRRFSGFITSAGALVTAAAFTGAGLANYGAGAFVSLCLMGPMIDLALTKVKSGWRLYFGLVLAGIATNLLALGSRGTSKLLGLDPGTRIFGEWFTQAIFTYSVSGAIAGLISALCFFHFRKRRSNPQIADSGAGL